MTSKDAVRDFWDEAACGEKLLLPSLDAPGFAAHSAERYRLESYIIPFADFENSSGLEVLEIGLGLGTDHERFVLAGAHLHGIDYGAGCPGNLASSKTWRSLSRNDLPHLEFGGIHALVALRTGTGQAIDVVGQHLFRIP